MQNESECQIREFITDNFFVPADRESLPGTSSLLEVGIIDSTGILELVAFLEGTFGIMIADEEIVPENLDSIEAIIAYLSRKQRAAAA